MNFSNEYIPYVRKNKKQSLKKQNEIEFNQFNSILNSCKCHIGINFGCTYSHEQRLSDYFFINYYSSNLVGCEHL